MDNDEIDFINDLPFELGQDEESGAFLVRYVGIKEPFAVIVAPDMEELYWLVDLQADPGLCECSALINGDAFFFLTPNGGDNMEMSEGLEDRLVKRRAWRPVDDGSAEKSLRAERVSGLEKEVSDLNEIFKDLKRKTNDRFNGHRRRSRKNVGTLEKARSRKNHSH